MQLIDAATVRSHVALADAREAVAAAFRSLADGATVTPDELAMRLGHGGELHVKGAYLGGRYLAFKSATGSFPGGVNSGFTAVLDAETGVPVAILDDGGWLTEVRTAAASAVSAQALARPDSRTVGLLGAGIQASFQVAALREAIDIDEVRVWSRTSETRERFAADHDVQAVDTVGAAVSGADIVVCCTPSREPLVGAELLHPGTHVIAMGSDMTGKRELAADVLARADLIVADDVAVACRVGELAHAPEEIGRAVDLGSVLTGRAVGRTDAAQITVSDHCGLGIQDAAMAELVMQGLAS